MKNSERRAWTEFVRQREQAPKRKKRERRSEQTSELGPPMADNRQCKRCQEWKRLECFHLDMALEESRHICRDCFAAWLDEQWALDQQQPRQT